MIRYMQHHAIDRVKYDHCVRMDVKGLVYGFSWYLDTLTESWDALILNDYDAVWPLPVRTKWGLKYFFRPFAVQQLGIFSKLPLGEEDHRQFIAAMCRECSFADIYLNEDQLMNLSGLSNIKTSLNNNFTLPLNRSYREIYHGFNKNTRRNIKRANEGNLSIFEHDSPDVLIELFKENKGDQLALSTDFYRNMKKIMFQCLHRGIGKIWTVYGGGNTVVAGAFFVEMENRDILLFTALNDMGKELQAMFFLLNEYIILASEKGGVLDFEGSNDPGIARFFKGFGSELKHYQRIFYNGLPLPLRWLKKE